MKLSQMQDIGGWSHPDDKTDDLKFIADARAAIAEGYSVIYDSWW